MAKASFPSDTIVFKASTGGNSAGNGGDGYNEGNIISNPSIKFEPSNKAEGADVHVKNGDDISQKAYWDAGGANAKAEGGPAKSKGMESYGGHKKSDAKAEKDAKAEGGTAKSKGDQESHGGHKKSDAKAEKDAKAEGGTAKSNGDQESYSGHNKSDVDANTKAYQENWLDADQSQYVLAGVGGDGGNNNKAEGGDVHIKASIETAYLNDVLNDSKYFDVDDFVHV
jgi:hypothetical protein